MKTIKQILRILIAMSVTVVGKLTHGNDYANPQQVKCFMLWGLLSYFRLKG